VKIGFITDGKSAAIDNSSEIPAGQAAAKYINDHLGGVAGHPITLDVCQDLQTPSGASDCANQMIADKVPVVLNGVSGQGGTIAKALSAAGVPFISYGSPDQTVLLTKGSFVLTNGIAAALSGPAELAKQDGAKRAAVMVIDVPAATTPVKAVGSIIYKNAGAVLDVVTVPPGTADMTPQAQAELSKNPDQVAIIGDAAFCNGAVKALKTLGFARTIVIIPQCLPFTSATLSAGVSGLKLISASTTDPSDPEVQLYKAVMSTYAPGTDPNGDVTSGGYAVVLGFARALAGLTGDLTPASVSTALATMAPAPLPLASGVTFQCNGKAVSIAPAICSAGVLIADVSASGQATNYKPFDASEVTKLG
jgi:branched-chain amino acid transport system substrate-binding protein